MGGKVWSEPEEEIFWEDMAPEFPPGLQEEAKAAKKGRKQHLKSWARFPEMMERCWDQKYPGQEYPRKWTPISMYEHYFQNFVQGKLSPHAGPYVKQYRAFLKKKAENPEPDSGNEESEALELSASQSSELSVQESSESEEPEPSGPSGTNGSSEFAVSVPTSTTFQQSATPQVPMSLEATNAMIVSQRQEYYRRWARLEASLPNSILSYGRESQERPSQRPRTMDSSRDDTNMSALEVFPEQSNVLAQDDTNIGSQFSEVRPAYRSFPGQNNGGAAYPSLNIGHHGAQNNANLFFDHNAAPVDYPDFTRPGLVQNTTNPFMGHGIIAQSNPDSFTGHGGVQKRKRTSE